MLTLATPLALLPALAPPTPAQELLIVDPADPSAFATPQAAVAAAAPGATILIADGVYPQTVSIGIPLTLAPRTPGGTVDIGRIDVVDLDADETVVLQGLSSSSPTPFEVATWIVRDCAGSVWLDACDLLGGSTLLVEDSPGLVVTDSQFDAGTGQPAIELVRSTLLMHGSVVNGGVGGVGFSQGFLFGLPGLPALRLSDATARVFGSQLTGGDAAAFQPPGFGLYLGGPAVGVFTEPDPAPSGAHDCYLSALDGPSRFFGRGNALEPGQGSGGSLDVFDWSGECHFPEAWGPFPEFYGHTLDEAPAPARGLGFAGPLQGPGSVDLLANGLPGDLAFATVGADVDLVFEPLLEAVIVPSQPWLVLPLGALDANGTGSLPISFPSLPGYVETFFAQGAFLDAAGLPHVGSPVPVVVIG